MMDRNGYIIYCDLGKEAVMRLMQNGQASMVADLHLLMLE